ncbi:MAG TPA: hypothetical protein VHH54_01550 [Actinomycetota bacterium]|nr:hypothetical protein [Actinomycetota bacterium]
MQEQPNIAQFLDELDGNPGLQGRWRANRRDILQDRGFSGDVLDALAAGNIDQIRELVRQQQGGDVTVLAYIK